MQLSQRSKNKRYLTIFSNPCYQSQQAIQNNIPPYTWSLYNNYFQPIYSTTTTQLRNQPPNPYTAYISPSRHRSLFHRPWASTTGYDYLQLPRIIAATTVLRRSFSLQKHSSPSPLRRVQKPFNECASSSLPRSRPAKGPLEANPPSNRRACRSRVSLPLFLEIPLSLSLPPSVFIHTYTAGSPIPI